MTIAARTKTYLTRFGSRKTLGADVKAGITLGVESVPDGLAAGLLAGLNPLHGLYAYMMGLLGGSLATGSVFMGVTATGAMAVLVADVPEVHGRDSAAAIAMLTLLTAAVMLTLGLARMGRLVRFIPTAVLIGFVNAVAINIVLGQLDNFTGYVSDGDNRVVRAVNTTFHLSDFSWPTVLVGAITIVLILVLERTRLGALSMVVAIIVASVVVLLLPVGTVNVVGDIANVTRTLPMPLMPAWDLLFPLIIPALSLALVGLVQGAAISGSIPNPDGRYSNASSDFTGQGFANVLAGVFQGMPVGGSMSATALARSAGSRSAFATLTAAVVMALTILLAGPLIGYVAMPALAGLLILIGIRTFKFHQIQMVWRTGPVQIAVFAVTFLLTLFIPLQYAVLAGVGLAIILQIAQQSNRIRVRRWEFDGPLGRPLEGDPPAVLDAGELVVLVPYGSLFFAAAPTFRAQLPTPRGAAVGATVILRLRGTDELGVTFLTMIRDYATELQSAGARLMLAGIGSRVHDQLIATGVIEVVGAGNVFPAEARIGDSLEKAMRAAE